MELSPGRVARAERAAVEMGRGAPPLEVNNVPINMLSAEALCALAARMGQEMARVQATRTAMRNLGVGRGTPRFVREQPTDQCPVCHAFNNQHYQDCPHWEDQDDQPCEQSP